MTTLSSIFTLWISSFCRAFCGCLTLSLVLLVVPTEAGILVGGSNAANGGGDPLSEVLNVIGDYNAANDPDLSTGISLFKKSDDDSAFVFDVINGFMFFTDLTGTTPILSEAALTSTQTAAFKYTGPENLLFYSVKGSRNDGFSLYTVMPGLNELAINGGSSEISHLSFWTGPPGIDPFGNSTAPEPSAIVLAMITALGFCSSFFARRMRTF